MQLSYRIIFFLKNFCTGLLMPVMTLMILDRGISLSALAWVMGAYSVMAFVMDVLVYLMLGAGNVAGNSLLASLLCGAAIGCVGIKGVWFGTGIVLLVVLLADQYVNCQERVAK